MLKNKKPIDNILLSISGILCFFSPWIGCHTDWTLYVLVLPIIPISIGLILGVITNSGKKSVLKDTGSIYIFLGIILANTIAILFHRDTMFLAGRIASTIGAVICVLLSVQNCDKLVQKDIEYLENRCKELEKEISTLISSRRKE